MSKNISKVIIFLIILFLLSSHFPIFAGVQSTTYEIKSYDFGSGGINNSDSTTYSLFGNTGQLDSTSLTSTSYTTLPGLSYLLTSNVPPAPTFTNPASYSNQLTLTINIGNNPTDTVFAIAISPDAFASTTKYVQADHTIGNNPVWQTNNTWGQSGFNVIGLTNGTTYTVKIAAKQGKYTQSAFGPTASAATVTSTLSFSLSANALTLTAINPSSVVTSPSITTTVTTSGAGGITIYGYDTSNGLISNSTNGSISSTTIDLGASAGYGLQATSVTQSSGGPMRSLSPYNGVNDNVGSITTTKTPIFDSSGTSVTSGQGTFVLKAKAANTTKAASDYADIVTIIAAGTF